jgi:hypothetical protein
MSNGEAPCTLCERDIDLILLEEFCCSPEFSAWFLERVTGESGAKTVDPKHSVKRSLLEIDLEVWFNDAKNTRWAVLIENKIGADFQGQQPERYQQRAGEYIGSGEAGQAKTVLVAPAGYEKDGCALFNVRFSYEEICDWLAKRDGGVRARYKAELIIAAIKKAQDGYTPRVDPEVSDFWQEYWKVAERQAPQLRMPQPGAKPARAGFIRFDPLDLPSRVGLIHKVRLDRVDLEFAGFGKRRQELQQVYGAFLGESMRIEKASGSGAIRIKVGKISPNLPFRSQEQKVSAAIGAAQALLEWFRLQVQHGINPPA